MYDIYKTYRDWSGKLRNVFIVGGFKTFEDSVNAISRLYDIHRSESQGRVDAKILVFIPKECTHIDAVERVRDSVAHNQQDQKHNPNVDLLKAYYGM